MEIAVLKNNIGAEYFASPSLPPKNKNNQTNTQTNKPTNN